MAKTTQKQRDAELCDRYVKLFMEALANSDKDLDVLRTGSGSIAIPYLDEERNERDVEITFKIPIGDRDGEPYDGYAEAEEYARLKKREMSEMKQAKIKLRKS